jgi:hypothetical protein
LETGRKAKIIITRSKQRLGADEQRQGEIQKEGEGITGAIATRADSTGANGQRIFRRR